jgi:hypothetical protein
MGWRKNVPRAFNRKPQPKWQKCSAGDFPNASRENPQHAGQVLKRHVAATLLVLTTLGVINAHVDIDAQDGRYFVVWQGKKHDVIGWLADHNNQLWRDCSAVQQLSLASPAAGQVLSLIAEYSPPDSRNASLVKLLQQGDWLLAELAFARLNPAVVVLRAEPTGLRLPERAVWSGSTAPWQAGPRIRQHLKQQVPQLPAALLTCYDPAAAGLR